MRSRRTFGTLILLLALVASSSVLAKTTLVHFAYSGHGAVYKQFIKLAIEEFEKANPDTQIEIVEGSDYTKALTMTIGGVGPDVLDMSTNLAFSYYVSGLLRDLTPYIEADKDFRLQDFVPSAVQGYQARGATFGIPQSIYQILCFYNKDLFLQAGLTEPARLGDKWDWDTAIASGKRLTKDKDGDGVADQWGIFANPEIYRWPIWVHQAGGLLFDSLVEPTKPTFDSPAGRAGLGFLASIWENNAGVPVNQLHVAHNLFYNGQIGFSLVQGPSELAGIPQNNAGQFEWDVAQLPKGPDNNGTFVIMNGFQISANSANPEVAWEWLKLLVSKEQILNFMLMTGRTPSRTALLREIPRTLSTVPDNLNAVADAVLNPHSTPPYLTPIYSELNGPSANAIRPVLLGEKNLVAALQELDTISAAMLSDLQ